MTDADLQDLKAFNERMAKMPARRAELILAAKKNHSWPEIAEVLGMTVHGAIKASKPSAPRGRPKLAPSDDA